MSCNQHGRFPDCSSASEAMGDFLTLAGVHAEKEYVEAMLTRAHARTPRAAASLEPIQSLPATTNAFAIASGSVNHTSWLPLHSTYRNSPSRSDNRGCHGMLCGIAASITQLR
jgi:hypothetical protein